MKAKPRNRLVSVTVTMLDGNWGQRQLPARHRHRDRIARAGDIIGRVVSLDRIAIGDAFCDRPIGVEEDVTSGADQRSVTEHLITGDSNVINRGRPSQINLSAAW